MQLESLFTLSMLTVFFQTEEKFKMVKQKRLNRETMPWQLVDSQTFIGPLKFHFQYSKLQFLVLGIQLCFLTRKYLITWYLTHRFRNMGDNMVKSKDTSSRFENYADPSITC